MRFSELRRRTSRRKELAVAMEPDESIAGLTIDDVWCDGCSGPASSCPCPSPDGWFVKRQPGD